MSNNQNLEKYGRWLVYGAALTPLLYIDAFYFPFIITKTIFFRLLMTAAAVLVLWFALKKDRRISGKMSWPIGLLSTYVLVQLVTSLFGLDFYRSFFSSFDRMEGIIYWIFLLIYGLALRHFFTDMGQWRRLFQTISVVSLVVALYAIVQRFALLPVFEAGIERVTSTIGNAAFLATYLLIATAISVYFALGEKMLRWRIFYWVVSAVSIYAALLTLTRGAFVGIAFGVFLFIFLALVTSPKKPAKLGGIAVLILGVVAAFGFVSAVSYSALPIDNPLLNRFAHVLDDPVTQNRLMVWQGALDYSASHWLTGAGQENFNYVFNSFYTPYLSEEYFDRTHNAFLDPLVMTGIFGFLLYIALYVYGVVSFWKLRKQFRLPAIAVVAGIVAYAINNFFVFETINATIIFLPLLVFASHVAHREQPSSDKGFKIPKIAVIILSIGAVASLYYSVYVPYTVNRSIYIGVSNILANKEKSYYFSSRALTFGFEVNRAANEFDDAYRVMVTKSPSQEVKEKFFYLVRGAYEQAHAMYPRDVRIQLNLAQLLIDSFANPDEIRKAEPLLREVMTLSPYRSEAYYLMGQMYEKLKEYDAMLAILREYDALMPELADTKLILANVLVQDDPELAAQYYRQAAELGFRHELINYQRGLRYLLNTEQYEEALPLFEAYIQGDPTNLNMRADYAQALFITGQVDAARLQLTEINDRDPRFLDNYQEVVQAIFGDSVDQ